MVALRSSIIVPLLAALIAFGGALFGGFQFDDYAIFSDPVLTSSSGWWEVWRPLQTRPLTYFTFWVNYQLSGQNPMLYHAINLALHLVCVWLVYEILKRLIPVSAAWLAAGIFALHPLQAEPIAYIFARGTLLATLFCLLSLRDWLRGRHWIAALWFAVALLAKEEVVAYPAFLLLLYFATSRNRRELKPLALMFLLSLAAGLRVMYVAAVTAGSAAGTQSGFTPIQYLATQGAVILRYLRLFLLPWGFTVDPDIPTYAQWWAWGILLIAVMLAARWFAVNRPGLWFIAGLLLLLPGSSIFPAADLSADRRMYFPLFAFAAALSLAIGEKLKPVLVVLLGLSVLRAQVWRTEESLWREAVERAPGKVRPKIQLARVAQLAEARQLLEEAKRLAPEDPLVASELGRMYLVSGSPEKALSEFGRALALLPNNPQALTNRGVALLLLKQPDAARQDFENALARNPCLFEARLNLQRMGVATVIPPDCRYADAEQRALTAGK